MLTLAALLSLKSLLTVNVSEAIANMTDSESFALYRETMLTRSGDGS